MLATIGARFAAEPGETQELRSEKIAVLLVASSCCVAGLVWTTVYWVVFGWTLPTALPLVFVAIVGTSLLVAHATRNHRIAVWAQLGCITLITALIQWSIGGIFDSGVVFVWAFLGPLGALMFFSVRGSLGWLALYLGCLAVTVGFDDQFAARALEVSDTVRLVFFAMNLGVASVVVFVFASYFVNAAVTERARANQLLLNVLPAPIAERLKRADGTIADHHEQVSVLFADVVGSTPLFARLAPDEVVDWLNEVFSALDDVVERHGLEKLRTMGDNFMVGSGVPTPRADHAAALVDCALDMVDTVASLPARNGSRIGFRFGINSGPAVAGVIGKSKFHYDLWGDAVNLASRMESTGEVGRVHVSRATYELIADEFECQPRGAIPVKGKGELETWFVTGRKPT